MKKSRRGVFFAVILMLIAVFTFSGCFGSQNNDARIKALEDQIAKLLEQSYESEKARIDELEEIIGTLRGQLDEVGVETTSKVIDEVIDSVVAIEVTWLKGRVDGGLVTGSGYFIEQGGYIATNSHVITPDPGYTINKIKVTLFDGRTSSASIVCDLPEIDTAILKCDISSVQTVKLDAEVPVLGTKVIAIGTPIGINLKFTCTTGIISGINREEYTDSAYHEFCIQHDAAINPGNSGGPLFNMAGRVIGMNSMGMDGYESLAFAIDISPVVNIKNGIGKAVLNAESYKLPTLNINVTDSILDSMKTFGAYTGSNVKVVSSANSKLKTGDIVSKISYTDSEGVVQSLDINNRQDYFNAILARSYGEEITLTVKRSLVTLEVNVIIANGSLS